MYYFSIKLHALALRRVSKARQPIESFFNGLNEKTNIQKAMKVRSTSELLVHTMGKIAIAFIYQFI